MEPWCSAAAVCSDCYGMCAVVSSSSSWSSLSCGSWLLPSAFGWRETNLLSTPTRRIWHWHSRQDRTGRSTAPHQASPGQQMTLQLPTRGAPPSNYEYSWDNEQRASSSSSSSCVRNGHDNSKGKGKMRSGMAASSNAAPPSSAAFLQSQRGSSSMYTTRGTSSEDVDSIRALEDKLHHTAALLQNRWVSQSGMVAPRRFARLHGVV